MTRDNERMTALRFIAVGFALVYPFVVYFGLTVLRPGTLALILALALMLRFSAVRSQPLMWLPLVVLTVYALLAAATDSVLALRLYPVLVSGLLMVVFGWTLWRPPVMIARVMALRGETVDPQGRQYICWLTLIWSLFFLLNGAVALYTALYSSMAVWALYNGLISYLLIGILIAGELIFRRYYKRRLAQAQAPWEGG